MEHDPIQRNGISISVFSYQTIVVGSGAAGYNAADCLCSQGEENIAIVTDHRKAGTSRNTGSDKQTYYKLSLAGETPESVSTLAQVLYHGGCVDGDIALVEAALSAQGFYKLVGLGVPFPKNAFGEYVGYKTDHDPSNRATSVGPYTSKLMTEALERSVMSKHIPLHDHHQVVRILTDPEEKKVLGLLCLNTSKEVAEGKANQYTVFRCKNIVYATGGPGGIYADSVYPDSHYGASGLAFEVGVKGKNLTEWQYGMASVRPRWNVSGTYMQVLPKFVSTDMQGGDPQEFLYDYFTDPHEMLSKVFLKGYQWPFDVRKIMDGSSIIDLLVYIEVCQKNRKVFLDFRNNPKDQPVDFQSLQIEAREYLEKAGACFGTPIERLAHMNQPAIDFYRDKGVDLATEPLEISLSAQHNNGGLSIDKWWQTNIDGFFAAGEVSGSHGVYRPGGSALNAGQVGSARAAEYIAKRCSGEPVDEAIFWKKSESQINEMLTLGKNALQQKEDTLEAHWKEVTQTMSRVGAAIRNEAEIAQAVAEITQLYHDFSQKIFISNPNRLWRVFRLRDLLLSQSVYLSAMLDYAKNGGKSRGSALYTNENGMLPDDKLSEIFRFQLEDAEVPENIQEITYTPDGCDIAWRMRRSLPEKDDFFETVWREFRENGNVN